MAHKKKSTAIDAKKVFFVLASIFLMIPLLYAAVIFNSLARIDATNADTRVGNFRGVCANQYVRGNIYVTYETFKNDVERIEFFIDNTNKVSTEQRYPYALNGNEENETFDIHPYDTTKLRDGLHSIKAVIYTAEGTLTDSISFNVANTGTRAFNQIVGVCNNQTVANNLYVRYEGSNESADRVRFTITGTNTNYSRTENETPFGLFGNNEDENQTLIPFDTKTLKDGTYTLRARMENGSQVIERSLNFIVANNALAPSPSPSQTPRPTEAPTPSPTLKLSQVDPNSGTDNHVNNFIKDVVRSGTKNVVAGGAWWGPVDKFFENQIWVVNRSVSIGRVWRPGEQVYAELACLLPGKVNPVGLSRNFLMGSITNAATPPRIRLQQSSAASSVYDRDNPLNTFTRLSQNQLRTTGPLELRTSCTAFEGNPNQFKDGSPLRGKDVHPVLGQAMWYGNRGDFRQGPQNHDNLPINYESLDNHAWYDNEGYVYSVLDGAEMTVGTNRTQLSNKELIGATVRGSLKVYGFATKGSTDLTKSLNGAIVNSSNMPIHHYELRIEQNGEDYTVQKLITPPDDTNGLEAERRKRIAMTLDTTILNDGWHVLSWHAHAIDHANPSPLRGKQLASEIKIPICVSNRDINACK